ncbi:MAG: hypothetical protein ABSA97_11990 [Verrucomicrobiia bacterium]
MKKFFRLAFLILLVALGYLAWQNVELGQQVRLLRETVAQLEKERRELQQQKVEAKAPAAKTEASASVRQGIEQQTSELRGLQFKRPVDYKMIDRAELREFLIKKVKEQYTDQEIRDYSRSLATLGLVPEGTDLMGAMISLYDEQVGAFYLPEERALYTFKDQSWTSGLDKMLLSHELTHALQDQNFDLTKFPLNVKDNDDLALASAALMEGDATVLMTRFYADNADPARMIGDVTALLGQNTAKLQAAPPYLRDMLLFPYVQGQQFAMALSVAGGVDALNDAFRHPPVSTQQILHPEKFLHDRRNPESLTLPRLDCKDWRLIGNNVLGEFGIRSLLEQSLGLFEALQVAQGWNGDRYNVYERGTNGPTALVWITAWDNEQHAAGFEDAYKGLARKRGVTARSNRDGVRVTIRQSGDESFFAVAHE